ncbi:hypothetical protein MMC07_001728 [Pseudocyphellaria aurata]|nr:hypothetical protein [Pseudocyphellaria aurata]
MPVTSYPAPHGADTASYFYADATPLDILQKCSREERTKVKQLIQSSFPAQDFQAPQSVSGSSNGFVHTVIQAYNEHLHLSIRPEDVWISILAQFSLYVNANAEELRSKFVAHEGQKELLVDEVGTIHSVDFGILAQRMTRELEKNVLDKDLRRWIMPSFTTTTYTDQVVAAIVMMGTLQKYFTYSMRLACGLPSVTLYGERSDWEDILMRLEKLPSFGEEAGRWYDLLKPVITRFVKTFDEPETEETKDFWQKIVHRRREGSGTSYYSGWITAFCFWNADGKSVGLRPETLNTTANVSSHFELDGVPYHRIDSKEVPPGFVSVPVLVDDNGIQYKTTMVAGSVACRLESAAAEVKGRLPGGRDALRPEVGWWMFENK